jgi:hypothetical protein
MRTVLRIAIGSRREKSGAFTRPIENPAERVYFCYLVIYVEWSRPRM